MCGLAGFWQPVLSRPLSPASMSDRLDRMAGRLAHRGPDDARTWVDSQAGLGLGFRRLAIRDVSPAGSQPMVSASGQTVLVFNGEIDNAPELRKLLGASRTAWRGGSDTEVLLEAIEAWGLETAVKKAVGMFAVAAWDRRNRCLTLARDRFGEKPLYYGVHNGVLVFGSELKALREHPAFDCEVDRAALTDFARYGHVQNPRTIYRGTRQLPPATSLCIRERDMTFGRLPAPVPYWNYADCVERGQLDRIVGTVDEAATELEQRLRRAVREQMATDVPFGAFLSGGIDSSLIVALMQLESPRPVRTFTIAFDQPAYNEAPFAAAVAAHLRTEHTEVAVTAAQAREVIPRLPEIYDEPFADSSQIPTFLVSQAARKHVTVSLSGDGGDEIFGGYARYPAGLALWRAIGWMPRTPRRAASRLLQLIPRMTAGRRGSWRRRLHWAAQALAAPTFDDAYRLLMSSWRNPQDVVVGADETTSAVRPAGSATDRLRRMMLADIDGYLPNDILVKVDRASMAAGLESRAPLLDSRVAEFAARLPTSMLLHGGQGKWILRTLLTRHVPKTLVDRPKMGFGVPLGDWLRGPLRGWAEDLLSSARLRSEGFWKPDVVRAAWRGHLSGRADASARLWSVLVFQSWHAAQQAGLRQRRVA